ncbi:MAG TPA: serine O-acetyltransferase [Rhodospirillales bacterium]|jgi:serine O-acetyltransferase|nr:MAG: Serine acetyltransferase [Alphaproteobacteria bacterium MarineAlpha3_Bin2]HIM25830.1 serine O-acetyltransferase [Rhodospirillales bacterium]HIM78029.1 serine O-acetyltransferase [Rhodospirillales bacterium]
MIFERFSEDIASFKLRDPAARSTLEIMLCYPGYHALVVHRLSHWLWKQKIYLLARFFSYLGRIVTAIEIHPGAEIGRRFVIDHGTGVVVGETAIVGDDVTLYHSVTLGGTSPAVDSHDQVGQKRHPTLKDGAIIGSGAAVLGPITIGEGARVGANSVVTKDIPAFVTAVGIPAKVIMPRDKSKAKEFQPYGTPTDGGPDPVLQTIESLQGQVSILMERVEELETQLQETGDADPQQRGGQTG